MISAFINSYISLKRTREIEQLRNEMYQKYEETEDLQSLVELSQKLDHILNRSVLSKTLKA